MTFLKCIQVAFFVYVCVMLAHKPDNTGTTPPYWPLRACTFSYISKHTKVFAIKNKVRMLFKVTSRIFFLFNFMLTPGNFVSVVTELSRWVQWHLHLAPDWLCGGNSTVCGTPRHPFAVSFYIDNRCLGSLSCCRPNLERLKSLSTFQHPKHRKLLHHPVRFQLISQPWFD